MEIQPLLESLSPESFEHHYKVLLRTLEGLGLLVPATYDLPPSACLPGHRVIGVELGTRTIVLGWYVDRVDHGLPSIPPGTFAMRALGRPLDACGTGTPDDAQLYTLRIDTVRVFRPPHSRAQA